MFKFLKKNRRQVPTKEKKKALWVDQELHSEITALADFKQMKIKDLVSNILKKAVREEIERGEFK